MAIEVSPEMTEAITEVAQASKRLRQALASHDREEQRRAQKAWLVAQVRRREAWRALATPVPTAPNK